MIGVLVGFAGRWIIGQQYITTVGLLPVLTISLAFMSYGAATVAWGSGFMAVFATASVLGNGQLGYRSRIGARA